MCNTAPALQCRPPLSVATQPDQRTRRKVKRVVFQRAGCNALSSCNQSQARLAGAWECVDMATRPAAPAVPPRLGNQRSHRRAHLPLQRTAPGTGCSGMPWPARGFESGQAGLQPRARTGVGRVLQPPSICHDCGHIPAGWHAGCAQLCTYQQNCHHLVQGAPCRQLQVWAPGVPLTSVYTVLGSVMARVCNCSGCWVGARHAAAAAAAVWPEGIPLHAVHSFSVTHPREQVQSRLGRGSCRMARLLHEDLVRISSTHATGGGVAAAQPDGCAQLAALPCAYS